MVFIHFHFIASVPGFLLCGRTLYESTVFVFPKAQLLGGWAIRILEADKQKENDMNRNIVDTVLKAVALGMGVAVIVLNALGSLSTDTAMTLLGFGVAALAIAGLQKS